MENNNADRLNSFEDHLARANLILSIKEMVYRNVGFRCFSLHAPNDLGNHQETTDVDLGFLCRQFNIVDQTIAPSIVELMMHARATRSEAAALLYSARTENDPEAMAEYLDTVLTHLENLEITFDSIEQYILEFRRLEPQIWWEALAQCAGAPHTQEDGSKMFRAWIVHLPEVQYQINELGWPVEEAINSLIGEDIVEPEVTNRWVFPDDEEDADSDPEVYDEEDADTDPEVYDEDAVEMNEESDGNEANDETFDPEEQIRGFVQQYDRTLMPVNARFNNEAAFRQNMAITSRAAGENANDVAFRQNQNNSRGDQDHAPGASGGVSGFR